MKNKTFSSKNNVEVLAQTLVKYVTGYEVIEHLKFFNAELERVLENDTVTCLSDV